MKPETDTYFADFTALDGDHFLVRSNLDLVAALAQLASVKDVREVPMLVTGSVFTQVWRVSLFVRSEYYETLQSIRDCVHTENLLHDLEVTLD